MHAADINSVRAALSHLDAGDREAWIRAGMAVKSEFGDRGFDVWDEWSQTAGNYDARAAKTSWKSFKDSGRITIASLFFEAKAAGWTSDAGYHALSDEEIADRARRAAQAAADLRAEHDATAARAQRIWGRLAESGTSAYLDRKQVRAYGLRFVRDQIVVPVRNAAGDLRTLQFIDAAGKKVFLKGSEKSGNYHLIGTPGPVIAVAEGYATAASVHLATGWMVAVAFDSGNLPAVAQTMRGLYPDAALVIAGDDDYELDKNAGALKANKAAGLVNGVALLPAFSGPERGVDWNDLHVYEGLDTVRALLLSGHEKWRLAQDSAADVPDGVAPVGAPIEVAHDSAWLGSLERTKQGDLRASVANVRTILLRDARWVGVLRYDEFSYRILKMRAPPMTKAKAGEWTDGDNAALRCWLADHYGITPGTADIVDAITVVGQQHAYHPVREYLSGLEWDGVSRLDHWLADYVGAQGPAGYLAAAGRKFMIGAVARVRQPGCKMDTVLILEGKQGKGKSSAVQALFGEWFSDAPIQLGDKDAYQNVQGCWAIEMAELDAFNRAESTTAKSFFSQRRDRYRPSYGRHAQDYPRQCVFVGTTNQDEYLKDYTGNRRYWPVRCDYVEVELLREIRDQLWAEAATWYDAGQIWWVDSTELHLFEREQDDRLQADPWEDCIHDWLDTITADFVTATDILSEAIKIPTHQVQKAHQMRIAPIMKHLGWSPARRRINPNSGPRRVYERASAHCATEKTL